MQVQLIIAGEQHKGRVIPINVPSFTIGRAEGANLRSRSPSVSRHHCTIQVGDDTVMIQDLGGENGTFVNGNRVTSPLPLKHGDKLVVGTHLFVLSIKQGEQVQETAPNELFELTPPPTTSPAPKTPAKSEESVTLSLNPKTGAAAAASKKAAQEPLVQEPEVMFEVRLDGQRVSVTKSRLFDLAQRGSISPDDLITVAGTKVFADSIQGIVFGTQSSAPPPPPLPSAPPPSAPPPQASPKSVPQAPARTAAVAAAESAPFDFSDFGDAGDDAAFFDNITAEGPAVRIARKESALNAIWKALDISFSRVYTMEGNNLVIHSIKALYYILVVVCLLVIFWMWFNIFGQGITDGNLLKAFSDHFVGLAVVTFGCVAIIVIVRMLIEMLLLAWLESARHEEEETEQDAQ